MSDQKDNNDFPELDRLRESFRSNLPDPSGSSLLGGRAAADKSAVEKPTSGKPDPDGADEGAEVLSEDKPAEKDYPAPTPGIFGSGTGWIHVPREERLKTYKRVLLGSFGILILAGILFTLDYYISSTTVPDLVGLSTSEAVSRIKAAGLVVDEVIESDVPGVEPGIVINQRPNVDARLRRGGAVVITVSSASSQASVPSVRGQLRASAEVAVASARLSALIITVYSDTTEVGLVVDQVPSPETVAPAGSTVAVLVSGGPASLERAVPRVIGLTEEAAATMLLQRGFQIAAYTGATELGSAGQIVVQTPGSTVESFPGSVVQVLLARGATADERDVPDVTGMSQAEAVAKLEEAGIGYDIVQVIDGGATRGQVAAQMPVAGSATVTAGERVGLLVSVGDESTGIVPNLQGRSIVDASNLVKEFGFVPVVVPWPGGATPATTAAVTQQFPEQTTSYRIGLPIILYAPPTK